MARLIVNDRKGPFKIDGKDGPVYICGCNLSDKMPYCSGIHSITTDEKPDVLVEYERDDNGKLQRFELEEFDDDEDDEDEECGVGCKCGS